MQPIRVSFSMLKAWERGDWDMAVAPFLGKETPDNEFMRRGKRWHRRFELETKRTGCAPAIFGGEKLEGTMLELDTKKAVKLTDWLYLSGVLDRLDKNGTRIIDYKVSKKNATYWANSEQPATYKLLYPEAKSLEFHCLNPYLADDDPERITMSIVHLTDVGLEFGAEWVLTQASGLCDYMMTNYPNVDLMRGNKAW